MLFLTYSLWQFSKSSSSPPGHWGWPSHSSSGWRQIFEEVQGKYSGLVQATQSRPLILESEHEDWQLWGSENVGRLVDNHWLLLLQIRWDRTLPWLTDWQKCELWKSMYYSLRCSLQVWLNLNIWSDLSSHEKTEEYEPEPPINRGDPSYTVYHGVEHFWFFPVHLLPYCSILPSLLYLLYWMHDLFLKTSGFPHSLLSLTLTMDSFSVLHLHITPGWSLLLLQDVNSSWSMS